MWSVYPWSDAILSRHYVVVRHAGLARVLPELDSPSWDDHRQVGIGELHCDRSKEKTQGKKPLS